MEPPAGLRGHSLVAQLGDQGPERAVVTETFKPESRRNLRAVVHGGYKYIRDEDSGAEELYHLVDDPGELHDLAAELPEHLARMRTLLAHELASGREPGATEEVELDEEEIRQLEALGYVR